MATSIDRVMANIRTALQNIQNPDKARRALKAALQELKKRKPYGD